MYVIDAEDRERLSEGWEVFGEHIPCIRQTTRSNLSVDSVLSNPQILGLPLLLIANKQDSPQSLSVDEIRHDYEDWHQRKLESARRPRYGETDNSNSADQAMRRERIASLDVMGVSALEGCVLLKGFLPMMLFDRLLTFLYGFYRTGVRAAVDWLFIRVQNSRRCVAFAPRALPNASYSSSGIGTCGNLLRYHSQWSAAEYFMANTHFFHYLYIISSSAVVLDNLYRHFM